MSSGADLRAASIAITVCPNGIGHAVRALRVLRELDLAHGPFGRLDVALSPAQLAALQSRAAALGGGGAGSTMGAPPAGLGGFPGLQGPRGPSGG
jgi:hypothetical protein